MAKKKKKKKSKGNILANWIVFIAGLAAVIGCAVSVISINSSIAEKKSELAQINKQIDSYTVANEDLTRILDSDDIAEYLEELAREEYNYAYPDEYRFYDTSRN